MAGKVQMIYIDPPYGVKYGSNFQPFVNKRDVKDGKDEDLTQEPEMIKAFRDTWELGIHSYLTYLRDRLLLARELLTESGSVFVQISDENVHHVREIMDEVFGKENYVSIINYTKTSSQTSKYIAVTTDYILWYSKNIQLLKYRSIYHEKFLGGYGGGMYQFVELEDGTRRNITTEEQKNPGLLPKNAKPYRLGDPTSQRQGRPSGPGSAMHFPVELNGRLYYPPGTRGWTTTKEGMDRLIKANRLIGRNERLTYIRYLDDFPAFDIGNNWTDTSGSYIERVYIVQTTPKTIQRCILMTTDPGDLVLDPTCGSGTTAYVSEQWGRRWITCDTSRVAVTLAKQRLMTSVFAYYELAQPNEGVGSGFRYKTVPHITLKSIANNEPPAQETLYDQPFIDNSRIRVTGPFTIEAVPSSTVRPLVEVTPDLPADVSVARSGETYRQGKWMDELLSAGIRGKGGQKIEFSRVEPLAGTRYLHADADTKESTPQRVVISFGPEFAPLEQRQVELAIMEAAKLVPKPTIVLFAAFQFDPEAAKDIDEMKWPGSTFLKVQMNADLFTDDLKKKRVSNESFWLIGQPDVRLEIIKEGKDKDKYRVEVLGFDYYNTREGTVVSGGAHNIAVWMLDTDYDNRSLYPRQVFFPMADEKEGWSRLARNLKAEIDQDLIEVYRGTVSLPFEKVRDDQRIAVKVVDDRGIESFRIIEVE